MAQSPLWQQGQPAVREAAAQRESQHQALSTCIPQDRRLAGLSLSLEEDRDSVFLVSQGLGKGSTMQEACALGYIEGCLLSRWVPAFFLH